ncbi:unnamed protein product [Citrullus colocynthis]|uniref:Uncharacterized protein n=1 Tax=Citrullus colocynthis TaxID=252529 RepID=A0ABP0Y039_9ROSI
MENSTENTKELNDVDHHSPFFLSFFCLLFQITMAIFRFLRFRLHLLSSSKHSYTVDSQPPPVMVDSPVDESGQEESQLARRNPPPPPPPSNGGGGQTN